MSKSCELRHGNKDDSESSDSEDKTKVEYQLENRQGSSTTAARSCGSKAASMWVDVATEQTLEEMAEVRLPGGPKVKDRLERLSRKRRAEDPESRNSVKKIKTTLETLQLEPLKRVLFKDPQSIARWRMKWGEGLTDNNRRRYHPLKKTVDIPPLVSVTDEDDANVDLEIMALEIAWNVGEEKVDFIYKFLEAFGVKLVLDAYNKTRDIEREGGMPTNDKARRRLAGGAFFQFLKECVPKGKEATFKNLKRDDDKVTTKAGHMAKKEEVQRKAAKCANSTRHRKNWGHKNAEAPLPKKIDLILEEIKSEEKEPGIEAEIPAEDANNPEDENEFCLDFGENVAEEMVF